MTSIRIDLPTIPLPAEPSTEGELRCVKVNAGWLAALMVLVGMGQQPTLWEDGTDLQAASYQVELLTLAVKDAAECQTTVLPVGVIMPFAAPEAVAVPTHWLECNGAPLSQADYPELFAVIGLTYDPSPGAGLFVLPDLRGRVVAGVDAPALPTALIEGARDTALNIGQMPEHSHNVAGSWLRATGGTGGFSNTAGTRTFAAVVTDSVGLGEPHSNLQPTMYLRHIIYAGEAAP